MAMVGCGGMARHHLAQILRHQDTTLVRAVCEPVAANYARLEQMFQDFGLPPPPNEPDLARMLQTYAGEIDAAFIITPHVYHHDQAVACLEAGVDVLLEKPMVMNAAEARSLMQARDRTGRLLVVAFNGSLSPQIRTAVRMLREGELGKLLNIHAVVWQNWNEMTRTAWRQEPAFPAAVFSLTPALTCSTPLQIWLVKTSSKLLRGSTTMAALWTSRASSWRAWPPGRWFRSVGAVTP